LRARLFQRRSIANLEVIRTESRLAQRFCTPAFQRRKVLLTRFDRHARAFKLRMDRRCHRALPGRQISIARAHREAIGLARRGRADDLDRHAQIDRGAPDDQELLVVLLAEHRDVRLHDVEQLRDDRSDAHEVTGPERAAQDVLEHRHMDARGRLLSARIDVGDFGREQQIDVQRIQHTPVVSGRARVSGEILVRTELQRIDEDADDHALRQLRRTADETAVAGVQVAHRRHERDALAVAPPGGHERAQFTRSGYGVHRQKQCSAAGYSRDFTAAVYALTASSALS
jgi:hypothetical protein